MSKPYVMVLKSTPETEYQVLDTTQPPKKTIVTRTVFAFAVIYKLLQTIRTNIQFISY